MANENTWGITCKGRLVLLLVAAACAGLLAQAVLLVFAAAFLAGLPFLPACSAALLLGWSTPIVKGLGPA